MPIRSQGINSHDAGRVKQSTKNECDMKSETLIQLESERNLSDELAAALCGEVNPAAALRSYAAGLSELYDKARVIRCAEMYEKNWRHCGPPAFPGIVEDAETRRQGSAHQWRRWCRRAERRGLYFYGSVQAAILNLKTGALCARQQAIEEGNDALEIRYRGAVDAIESCLVAIRGLKKPR